MCDINIKTPGTDDFSPFRVFVLYTDITAPPKDICKIVKYGCNIVTKVKLNIVWDYIGFKNRLTNIII